jgi:uncharacterized SAM-binding protein YcdF (DUF218 family)
VTVPSRVSALRRWSRRVALIVVNLLLIGAIVGLIAATWLPAILDEGPAERSERRWRR